MSAFIFNVTFGAKEPRVLRHFWSKVTSYAVALERDDFVALRAPDHRGVRNILFVRVDDPTPGKNRMHVDLATRDPDAKINRVIGLGAQLVDPRVDGKPSWREGNETRWVVPEDPESNEFCIG